MRCVRSIILFAGAVTLAGCASMSEEECRFADWRTIGFEDGARGSAADTLGAHRQACAEHGVVPDLDAYRAGRDEGLREYCRPERGFALGSAGTGYSGVCPADLEVAFVDAWRLGKRLDALRDALDDAEDAVEELEDDRRTLGERRREIEAALIADGSTPEQRAALLSELRDLEQEAPRIEADLADARAELAWRRDDLADYEDHLAARGY